MRLFVGVTNNEWFRFLSEQQSDEVNFWRPRSQTDFKALEPGDLFLFKLHSPLDYIAGGGVFVRHSFLPLPLAWQAFGEKNGVADYDTFERRILEHRDPTELTRQLGCTILVQPFFWPRELWIPAPADWKKNIVSGKGYSTSSPMGMALWSEVKARLERTAVPEIAAAAEEKGALRRAHVDSAASWPGGLPGGSDGCLFATLRHNRGKNAAGTRSGAHPAIRQKRAA